MDLAPGEALRAHADFVAASERRTALASGALRIETVEHCLAAAAALELDDLMVELEGPELPIGDGSFAPFVEALDRAGVRLQEGDPTAVVPRRRVAVEAAGASYTVQEASQLELDVFVSVDHPEAGPGRWAGTPSGQTFRTGLAPARTYGFFREVETLRARGLLQGATADCAVILFDDGTLSTALRWPDELVRHKAGDLLGDLALVGGRLRARVEARQPNHRGNLACVRAILDAAHGLEAG
jgi:UDP-3-O-acyl N-acetylglucosamine deacetylase